MTFITDKTFTAASQLGRELAHVTYTDAEITAAVERNAAIFEVEVEPLRQLALWLASHLRQKEKQLYEQHGRLIAALHQMKQNQENQKEPAQVGSFIAKLN